MLELLEIEGSALRSGSPKRGRSVPRKPGKAAARDAKLKRKVVRTRK